MKSLFQWFALLIAASIITIFLYRFDFMGFKSNFALDFVDAASHFFRKQVSLNNFCAEEKKALEVENQNAISEIQRLKTELATRVDLTKESLESEIITVAQDEMIINRGISSSVSVDQKVIIGQSLVGAVLEIEKNRSLIGLLNNPKTKILCNAENDTLKVWGLLTGKSDGKIYFTKILQTKKVARNNKIFCSGFYAGKIKRLIKNESDLFYEAEVSSAVSAENLRKVYVVN